MINSLQEDIEIKKSEANTSSHEIYSGIVDDENEEGVENNEESTEPITQNEALFRTKLIKIKMNSLERIRDIYYSELNKIIRFTPPTYKVKNFLTKRV